jgi:hypothetical protein
MAVFGTECGVTAVIAESTATDGTATALSEKVCPVSRCVGYGIAVRGWHILRALSSDPSAGSGRAADCCRAYRRMAPTRMPQRWRGVEPGTNEGRLGRPGSPYTFAGIVSNLGTDICFCDAAARGRGFGSDEVCGCFMDTSDTPDLPGRRRTSGGPDR